MNKRILLLLLSISIVLPQLSIKGKQIHNNELNEYYSFDEFIRSLDGDPNFVNDENFINYKKYANRLKFKKSKYIYGISLLSIGAGHDGIVNSDEFEDDENPPGAKNIAFGILLSSSYYTYNTSKKKKSLRNVIRRHNNIYSKNKIVDYSPPDRWYGSVSYGFLSEKTPVSIIECSGLYNIDKHSEFYIAIGTMLFGTGIGSGYKYYYKNKFTSSMFISIGSQLTHLGTADDMGQTIYGLSISPGYSIINKGKSNAKIAYREKFGGKLKEVEYTKNAINVGISFMYLGDKSVGFLPFINLEKRF